MKPVDSTPPAMEILQRRMAANLDRLQRDGSIIISTSAATSATTPATKQERRKALRQRLKGLDENDPRFTERAADAFVELALLEEFGESLTNDVNFRQLILQVSRDMRGDADTAKRLLELFGDLRGK